MELERLTSFKTLKSFNFEIKYEDDVIDLELFYLDEKSFDLSNLSYIHAHNIYPIYECDNRLIIGINENTDFNILKNIENTKSKEIVKLKVKPKNTSKDIKPQNISIVSLLNWIINYAIKLQASDIHIEPFEKYAKLRFRLDGDLNEIVKLSHEAYNLIVNRIKFLAGIDIAEKRMPLDGKFSWENEKNKYDLRVSTIPTYYGEKIVIRILDRSSFFIDKNRIGLLDSQLEVINKALKRNKGIIIVTGPTGSGKSTTLYSILNEVNTSNKNIVTIEDPVEYTIEGINQINVNYKTGLTFSVGLRSILRQDPDVIMIGEIRDVETAEIAIKAAVTGHLVLSTFHTNDAFTTITRLLDIGIEPFLLASSLNTIISQRLVKTICPYCRYTYEPSNFEKEILNLDIILYKGRGCSYCNFTGYKGRTGIFEVMEIYDEHRKVIVKGYDERKIKDISFNNNFVSLLEHCKDLVIKGKTTFDEYLKTISLFT